MKRLLSTVAAVALSAGISWGANNPLITGPMDPSTALGNANQLIQNINTNTSGVLVAFTSSTIVSAATTAEQNLFAASINANTLALAGQSLRARCFGTTAANGNSKTPKLYIGTSSITSPAISSSGENWELELVVTMASAQGSVFLGRGSIGPAAAAISPVATTNVTDLFTGALTARCSTTQGSSAADTTGIGFVVEQIK